MKAIAEYFRDLAADDRYFGAEPPTPDAEMLARIAEREIARRVDAHEDHGRIVLRAGDSAQTDTPADAGENAPRSADAPPAGPPAQGPAEDRPDSTAALASAPPDADSDDSVAARLRRIRAVTAHAEVPYTSFDEDEHAQAFLDITAADLDAALRADDAAEDSTEGAYDDDGIGTEPTPETQTEPEREPSAETQPEPEPEEVPEIETVPESETVPEPETVPEIEDSTTRPGPAIDFEGIEETAPGPDAEGEDDDTSGWDDETVDHAGGPESDSREIEDTLAQLMADALKDEEKPSSDDGTHALTAPGPKTGSETSDVFDDGTQPPEPDNTTEQADPETGARETSVRPTPAARVVKMKRSDIDAAITGKTGAGADDTEEKADHESGSEAAGASGTVPADSSLSPEDEAELQRELAAVEAELGGDSGAGPDTPHDKDDGASAGDQPAGDDPNGQSHEGRSASTDVSRMFDEAEHHLETPDSHERRAAIRHMRKAVTAAEAEKRAGHDISGDADDKPYRLDLADVVEPSEKPNRRERPARQGTRLAPLKLVAEQRIDTPRDPVQPRRVARDHVPATDASGGETFAEFANAQGARELPELLEAAAAFMADVEGRTQFSRPMLMHKLREVQSDGFSREEGLRSFGQLLRSGKLQKLKGGRFTVTDATEYRPAARNVG
ncbi:hypothetical protein DQW77_06060 [Roseovarius sp. TE539]|nr:hypothetical protein DQW77_06060 [Roseovarius sp. TE539]